VNRNELVDAVAGKADLTKSAANKAVDAVFESIRNPRTGEKIKIAASQQAKFKPGKRLRDELN
jgi:DNA-binding protein HU-beta